MKKVKAILSALFFICSFHVVDALTLSDDAIEKREALVRTAEAYYQRGTAYQYDQYRENRYSTPEDATSDHPIYAVCSTFVNEVYRQTFMQNTPDEPNILPAMPVATTNFIKYAKTYYQHSNNNYHLASENENSGDYILKYYAFEKNSVINNTLFEDTNLTENAWANFLLPGDILVFNYMYIEPVIGHTMMVYSVDASKGEVVLIDNNGHVYDNENYSEEYEINGSIGKTRLNQLLNSLIGTGNSEGKILISDIALIRYVTDIPNASNTSTTYLSTAGNVLSLPNVSAAAKFRKNYPDIYIQKTSRVMSEYTTNSSMVTAGLGDKIKYIIKIKNNSNENYENLIVSENIQEMVKLVTGTSGYVYVDGTIEWKNITILAGEEKTFEYIVKIPINKNLNKEIITSTGKVAKSNNEYISNATIYHYIGQSLSSIRKESINLNTKISDMYDLNDLNNAFVIQYQDDVDNPLVVKNTAVNATFKNIVLGNLYGLAINQVNENSNNLINPSWAWKYLKERSIEEINNNVLETIYSKNEFLDTNNRVRNITKDMLEIGDIILLYDYRETTPVQKRYLYAEIGKLKNDDTFEIIEGNNLDKFLRDIVGNNFVILRPALNELMIGDTNLDGVFNKNDIKEIAKYIVDKNSNNRIESLADINNDDQIKMNDVVKLYKILNNN